MQYNSKIERIDSLIIASFIAVSSICSTIGYFINIPFISVIITFLLVLIVLFIHNSSITINLKCLFLYLFLIVYLLVSGLINGIDYILKYFLYFIVFGLSSLVFVSLRMNYKQIIINILKLYFFIIVIYFAYGRKVFLNSNDYWTRQMGMAYNMVIPFLFSFGYLLRKKKLFFNEKKLYTILALFELIASIYIILIDCGTRGAIISIVIGSVLIALSTTKKSNTIFFLIIVTIIATCIFVFQFDKIFDIILKYFKSSAIRALTKVQMASVATADNGRLVLYKEALDYFIDSPILGKGIGYFESMQNGSYVHQFFLEILCEYGFIGVISIFFMSISFLKRLNHSNSNLKKLFLVTLLGLCIVLLFSNSYFLLTTFWFTVFLILKYKNYTIKEINKNG